MEIEIKAKIQDFRPVKIRLQKTGAKKIGVQHQIDTYYLPYARKLIPGGKDTLRIRHDSISGKSRLEYHHFTSRLAGREHEVGVADIKMLAIILQDLRCKKIAVVDKKRESYQYQNMEIVLDTVKGLGKFMEIEIQGRDSKANRRRIVTLYKKLGVTEKQFVWGPVYHGMVLNKKSIRYHYFK